MVGPLHRRPDARGSIAIAPEGPYLPICEVNANRTTLPDEYPSGIALSGVRSDKFPIGAE